MCRLYALLAASSLRWACLRRLFESLLLHFYAGEGVEVVVVLYEYLPVAEDLAYGGVGGICSRVRVVDGSSRG